MIKVIKKTLIDDENGNYYIIEESNKIVNIWQLPLQKLAVYSQYSVSSERLNLRS